MLLVQLYNLFTEPKFQPRRPSTIATALSGLTYFFIAQAKYALLFRIFIGSHHMQILHRPTHLQV